MTTTSALAPKPRIVEVVAEDGDNVQPPPPEILEPDPDLTPEQAEQVRKDYLLTRFWISARGFWGKGGDRLAWPFSIGLLALIVANVGFQYGINSWNRAIFDAIEKRDSATVFHLTAIFFPLAIGSVLLGVAQVFARMGIQRRWRAWLTDSVVSRWLTNGRYYQLNLVSGDHQNPEYRIAEDLRIATDSPVDFMAGVTSAFLSASTFIIVLWTIGGALTVTVAGSSVTIPGFLVIAAVLYAVIASGSILTIGRRFVQISEDRNQAEAEYRYALTRVRENGESIALLGGEQEERDGIDKTFAKVLRQWARLAGQHMRTTLVSQGSSLIAPVVPLLLCAPKFLDGSMDAWAGDAGGLRLHHRAERVRMAGRQLSTARRLECVRPTHCFPDDVARRARACRTRRWLRPDQARRDRRGGNAQPERSLGDARRRHGGGR